jgi:signal transduction histidine kinase
LTILVAVLVAAVLAGTFVATYNGTGTQVRGQIDRDLSQDLAALMRDVLPATATGPQQIATAARGYVARQPVFGTGARLLIIRITGGETITNQPELLGLAREPPTESESPGTRQKEAVQARELLAARPGRHTTDLVDAGDVRLLVSDVRHHGTTVARVAVGESVDAVTRAQRGVARTFLVAGSLALVVALIAGYLLAGGLSRPLRRMARIAAEVDAGRWRNLRMAVHGAAPEVRVLADSFDHMLDRLEDSFARQREFVADASHELRSPLTAIRGQLEVLARERNPRQDDIERVQRLTQTEITRMERLVDDLLLLAHADEGEPVALEPIEVEPFMIELLHALRPTADRRFELGPLPRGTLLADPDRTAQVIRNLARNAIQHTATGGLVRLVAVAEGDVLEIAVEDDGPGIPPAERERVFDRFHRADRSRARSEGGTGLGLAIARAIVEAHGGTIRAEQARSGGARVAFVLPRFKRSE